MNLAARAFHAERDALRWPALGLVEPAQARPSNLARSFFAPEVASHLWETELRERGARRVASEWKRKTEHVAQREVLDEWSGDGKVKHWGLRRACEAQVIAANEPDEMSAYCAALMYVRRWHIGHVYASPPRLAKVDGVPQYGPWLARVTCKRWWTRAARRMLRRGVEIAKVDAGTVHDRAARYVSDYNVEATKDADRRNAQLMLGLEIEDENGRRVALADVAKGSISDPWVRFSELMVRAKGLEALAEAGGWVG